MKKLLSLAGYMLTNDYKPTNHLSKSIIGAFLKCFGDKGFPNLENIKKAQMIVKAGTSFYKKEEVQLAIELLKHYA